MALARAVGIGMVGALLVPAAFRRGSGALADQVRASTIHLEVGSFDINFSWPIFAVVTLLAWGFMAWSNR
jgi:hypothetical protein